MTKISAGILVYREINENLEVLLVHPGGPYWAKKEEGAWSIPKGESEGDEDLLTVARREFMEETGAFIDGNFTPLVPLKQPGGKLIFSWAIQGDLDTASIKSNTFTIEWPPKSGRQQEYPEVDRAGWFHTDIAMKKILKGQKGFITQLLVNLGREFNGG
jgi:predicted NUDIX family NTP pyrophosphohydrolase